MFLNDSHRGHARLHESRLKMATEHKRLKAYTPSFEG